VIVSTFPDSKTKKKNVLVYDRKTGKRIGSATLDAADEATDVSDDSKQIIYKKAGKVFRTGLSLNLNN
jgi:hypothetical protein